MSANLPRPSSDENISTTLSSGITDVATSMDVGDASKLAFPCYLVIDRVDSAGTLKATSLWEYVKVTNIAANTLTITRAQGGSTNQAHSSGAVVEAVITSSHFEDWYNALNPEHDSAGGHVVVGTMTVAGMNLASVATIAAVSMSRLDASNATIIGVPIAPVFSFVGTLSGATVFTQTPLIMPRSGRWQSATFLTRTVASGVSAIVDINLNGTSIFDTVGRPMIAAGGTFVSTASIKTPAFTKGGKLTWDYDGTGGTITDFNIQLISN
jgi:hypothetical protein